MVKVPFKGTEAGTNGMQTPDLQSSPPVEKTTESIERSRSRSSRSTCCALTDDLGTKPPANVQNRCSKSGFRVQPRQNTEYALPSGVSTGITSTKPDAPESQWATTMSPVVLELKMS